MRNKRRIFCNFAVFFVESTPLGLGIRGFCGGLGMILTRYGRQNFS